MFNNTDYILKNFPNGAFLISGDICNPMTIGWGFVGVMWGKPIFIAPVRDSRFTKELIEKSGYFTVSAPYENEMAKALKICGTKSGRQCDKWIEAGLAKQEAKKTDGVVVRGCKKFYECKVLGSVRLDKSKLDGSVGKFYGDGDMHNLYFGEILAEYSDID